MKHKQNWSNSSKKDGKQKPFFKKKKFHKKFTLQRNNKKRPQKQDWLSKLLTIFLIFFIISSISNVFVKKDEYKPTFSELVQQLKDDKIEQILVKGVNVEVLYKDKREAEILKDPFTSFEETLINFGASTKDLSEISFSIEKETGIGVVFKAILPFLFPALILIVFIWFMSKQLKSGGMQLFNFGRSKAKYIDPKDKKRRITFKDVSGDEEAKQELREFVDFLKKPQKFLEIGAKIPKGILLYGPPGTGKTLMARAMAGEAEVPFFSISGSEFVEMFVGIGASRVRDLFENAKKTAPSIIFIDEIDAVGRVRGSGFGGGNDEREQALNQILVEMDGFVQTDKVIVIASTNRIDILDPALLRPGRFDRKVMLQLPDIKERRGILGIHARGKQFEENIEFDSLARRTPGFSGADLEAMINEAGINAVRDDRKKISQNDLFLSIEKVLLGPERRSKVLTEYEKRVIAYHEAGHALLASVLPFADPVQKITIVGRGNAGGYVLSLPDFERKLKTRNEFIDTITMSFGGYVAEKLIFSDVSTGPSNDISQATALAEDMVMRFGMSNKLGPISLHRDNGAGALQKEPEISQETKKLVDAEVRLILKDALKKAERLVKRHKNVLDKIVDKLFEVETLEREEFEKLIEAEGIKIKHWFNEKNDYKLI